FILRGFGGRSSLVHVNEGKSATVDAALDLAEKTENVLMCICDPVVTTADIMKTQRVITRSLTVLNESGVPLEGAQVKIAGLEYLELVTGVEGTVSYEALDGDTGVARVTANGFLPLEADTCCLGRVATLTLRHSP